MRQLEAPSPPMRPPDPGALRLRVHAITHGSLANGPGVRTVVHTQGCTLACPGCFNPHTHAHAGGELLSVDVVLERILAARATGVSFSGGEPTEQLEALTELCARLRGFGLSVLLFSGRTLEEIQDLPGGPDLLNHLDVLVDGRFVQQALTGEGLRGSSNQRIHLLSDRHQPAELALQQVEVHILPDGSVRMSGFPSPRLSQALRRAMG